MKIKNGYKHLKPVGIIASLTPSTNAATPAHHIMLSKSRKSIIISPFQHKKQ